MAGAAKEENLDAVIDQLTNELHEQDELIETLEQDEMRLHTQIKLLKIVLLQPMREYHQRVREVMREGSEEEAVAFRKVAPPPDLGIFEL